MHHAPALTLAALCLLWAGGLAVGRAQQPVPVPPPPLTEEAKTDAAKALATMRALKTAIADGEAEIEAKRAELGAAATPAEQDAIRADIQALTAKVAELRTDFEGVAAGIDLRAFVTPPEESVDLGAEMEDFLQPIVRQLKDMTSRPREIEQLKNNVAYNTKRKQLAEKALEHVSALLATAEEPAVVADLEALRKAWQQRFDQADNNLTIAEFQLESKQGEKGTVFQTVRGAVADFFRTRGRNLLLAAVAFLVVFSALRLFHRYLHRLSPMRKRGRRSIAVRLIDIGYYFLTFAASTGVVLFVLYITDDWVLLGLALLLLAGAAWAGKHTLPLFYEQGKLMLNLGSVREGERIIYNGVPWRVEAINVFTDLTNPALQGGRLRLPLRELVPLLSRPFGAKEPWFPSEEGDWVVLSDETFGKVVAQTPEWVQLVILGGSRKTFTTPEFIALNPENLSTNFRVNAVFGVDYQHQAICTTEIPQVMHEKLRADLEAFVGKDNLNSLSVEFCQAGASSLDYEILADFGGEAAPKYRKIKRAIPRICVDACNEHGWVIPFTQVTLHQASPAKAPPAETPAPAGS